MHKKKMDNHILQVETAAEWNSYLSEAVNVTFLQSWEFGEVHQALEHQVQRFVVKHNDLAVLIFQTFIVSARRGRVLQVRHAPIITNHWLNLSINEQQVVINDFLNSLNKLAVDNSCDFVRVQSRNLQIDNQLLEVMVSKGYRSANTHNIDAEKTLLLDITRTENDLLSNMRKNTRYYIRKAEKDGVIVHMRTDQEAVKEFYSIHKDTTIRQHFKSYPESYYKEFVSKLNSGEETLSAKVFIAEYEQKNIAAAIVVYMQDRAFYSDGGSLSAYSKIPASYLIQWKAIQYAKELGCKTYDFWGGVVPHDNESDDKDYPWKGIDLFKRGFGGDRVEYMHAHDLGLTAKYKLTRIWEYIEKKRRGY